MERDWEADEIAVAFNAASPIEIRKIALIALTERARLADLLAWKPGPPTEPGLYVFILSHDGLPYSELLLAHDFKDNARPWIKDVISHLGPLPEPPKAEVAG